MLDKQALASALESAMRSVTPGKDSVAQLCGAMASAIDAFVKSGEVTVKTVGGTCTYSGGHPELESTGKIK